MVTEPWPTLLEIDLDAVAANWRSLGSGAAVGAVLKADAYGLGAVPVATRLYAEGCRHFFVAHPAEALAIATMCGGHARRAEWAMARRRAASGGAGHCACPRVPGRNRRVGGPCRVCGRSLPALLHVDTGMNRLGLDDRGVDVLAREPDRLRGIDLRYIMTHLVSAECPDDPVNEAQRQRFAAACARLPPAPRSFANSSGLFLGPGYASDLARPGAALYGVNPTPGRPNPMRQTVRLAPRVLQIRDLLPGEGVGYNGQWVADRPSRIATVSVGYADGFLRALTNRAIAYFDDRPVPLVGRVSMDLSTFDVTESPGLARGGWLDLIGRHNPVDALAEQAGTNGYEILTSLGRRYPRVYL